MIDRENIAAVPVQIEEEIEVRRLNDVIGVFGVCNAGGICVHAIDHAEDRVKASMNGENPEWYPIVEKPRSEFSGDENDMELESGFEFGSFFVPFCLVMRV